MASDAVSRFFSTFGSVTGVDVPDPNKAQCLVTFAALEPAAAAQAATNKRACNALGGRTLWVEFARDPEEVRRDDAAAAEVAHLDPQHKQQELWCPAVRDSADLGVPGATLVRDFVTPEEEREILAAVDADTRWQRLAKRRVLHYGFAFDYGTRDARSPCAPAPRLCDVLLERAAALPIEGIDRVAACDQLTVNEYERGVGLAPHVDTHSAFGPVLLSASLAGSAVMEFRLLEGSRDGAPTRRAAIHLPPRSLLVMTGEARYWWQHYVPHRKRDSVAGEAERVEREPERVSLTFRERRTGPCECRWPDACDSRMGAAQLLRARARPGMVDAAKGMVDAAERVPDPAALGSPRSIGEDVEIDPRESRGKTSSPSTRRRHHRLNHGPLDEFRERRVYVFAPSFYAPDDVRPRRVNRRRVEISRRVAAVSSANTPRTPPPVPVRRRSAIDSSRRAPLTRASRRSPPTLRPRAPPTPPRGIRIAPRKDAASERCLGRTSTTNTYGSPVDTHAFALIAACKDAGVTRCGASARAGSGGFALQSNVGGAKPETDANVSFADDVSFANFRGARAASSSTPHGAAPSPAASRTLRRYAAAASSSSGGNSKGARVSFAEAEAEAPGAFDAGLEHAVAPATNAS